MVRWTGMVARGIGSVLNAAAMADKLHSGERIGEISKVDLEGLLRDEMALLTQTGYYQAERIAHARTPALDPEPLSP